MQRPVSAFFVKLIATIAAFYFVALFFPLDGTMNFLHALILGLIVAVIGYISDILIVRAVNKIVGVYVDIAIATIVTYFGNYLLYGMHVSWTFALLVGLLIGAVEMVLHSLYFRRSR